MFHSDFPIELPGAADVLAETGIDPRAVSEVIADDRAMRCPDRDTVLRGGATAILDTAMPFEDVPHEAATAEPFGPHPSRRTVRWSGGGL